MRVGWGEFATQSKTSLWGFKGSPRSGEMNDTIGSQGVSLPIVLYRTKCL